MAEAPDRPVLRSYRIRSRVPQISACGRPRQRASLLRFMLDRSHVDRFEFNAAPRARHSVSVHF
jgi:hypothetical protein